MKAAIKPSSAANDIQSPGAARFPVMPPNQGWGFRLFARRAGDFALVGVATTLTRGAAGGVKNLRLAVGGIGPAPVCIESAVEQESTAPADAAWTRRVAQAAANAAEIEPSERIAVEYRRELVAALTQDALTDALERAG